MKSLLIDGLLKQGIESSAAQISMWENMTVWELAYQKTISLYTSQDGVSKMLEDERIKLTRDLKRKPAAIEGKLLKAISDHLSINTPKIKSVSDLDDLGLDIENKVIVLQRKVSKNAFEGNTIQDLIKYNLKKMFDDLSVEFEKKDKEEQTEIVKRILDILEEMPDEQKEILRKELNVDELSAKTVSKAITTGALGIAFATVVGVAGFSAYIFAVEALATITGIIGITLPFAASTTLTSMMAALANPLLIIPATLGLGYFMTNRGNRQIRDALLPTIITQIAVSASKEVDTIKKSEQLVRRLKKLNIPSGMDDILEKTKRFVTDIKFGK